MSPKAKPIPEIPLTGEELVAKVEAVTGVKLKLDTLRRTWPLPRRKIGGRVRWFWSECEPIVRRIVANSPRRVSPRAGYRHALAEDARP